MPDSGLGQVNSDQLRSPVDVAQAYIQAWNAHDGEAVVRTFAGAGTYVDPTLPEPLSGEGIKGLVDALVTSVAGFDVRDRINRRRRRVGRAAVADDGNQQRAVAGMSTPTGGTTNLPGIDVIAVGPDGITSVVGYFDQLTLLAQLGLDVEVGPPTRPHRHSARSRPSTRPILLPRSRSRCPASGSGWVPELDSRTADLLLRSRRESGMISTEALRLIHLTFLRHSLMDLPRRTGSASGRQSVDAWPDQPAAGPAATGQSAGHQLGFVASLGWPYHVSHGLQGAQCPPVGEGGW